MIDKEHNIDVEYYKKRDVKTVIIPKEEYEELKELKEMFIQFRHVLVKINNSMY